MPGHWLTPEPWMCCPVCGSDDLETTEHRCSGEHGPQAVTERWATYSCRRGHGPFDLDDLVRRDRWEEMVAVGLIEDPFADPVEAGEAA